VFILFLGRLEKIRPVHVRDWPVSFPLPAMQEGRGYWKLKEPDRVGFRRVLRSDSYRWWPIGEAQRSRPPQNAKPLRAFRPYLRGWSLAARLHACEWMHTQTITDRAMSLLDISDARSNTKFCARSSSLISSLHGRDLG
jgi:hypothetical protein